MINKTVIILITIFQLIISCSDEKLEKKGFSVTNGDNAGITKNKETDKDTLEFRTRPRNVLLTKFPEHRLTPIFKVNLDKKTKKYFTGSVSFHSNYDDNEKKGNNWNGNFMPGFEAIYGYNMVNVSHYNTETKKKNNFFKKPVLIKTLYYPAYSNDTLNFKPVIRNYYMVSVYDEDTNKDKYIDVNDLRRFYLFNLNGKMIKELIPKNYSVMNSEFDNEKDYMYIFAREDKNENGKMDDKEEIHIFWIDLKNPENNGRVY